MIASIKWFLHLKTNALIFGFIDNNWLLIGLVMVALKIVAKITPTSVDDSIVGLIDGWLKDVKGIARGAAGLTVQAAKATGGAVKERVFRKTGDPWNAADEH